MQISNQVSTVKDRSIWEGLIDLNYHYKDQKTRVKSSYTRSPFRLQTPFYPENDHICHSVIIHTAGGIVGGDRLVQNINLEENCHALITTPAAAKIYKTNGLTATQSTQITIASNSILEFLPQENIIFKGAKYQQNFQVLLGENSRFCTWEINRFGRTARGEKFNQGDWQSSYEVIQNGKLIWIDHQRLEGSDEICTSLNGLNNYAISATFYWLGDDIPDELVSQCRDLISQVIDRGEAGVTTLTKGMLCRYRGNSSTEVKRWFLQVWGILRRHFLNKDKIVSRIWQL